VLPEWTWNLATADPQMSAEPPKLGTASPNRFDITLEALWGMRDRSKSQSTARAKVKLLKTNGRLRAANESALWAKPNAGGVRTCMRQRSCRREWKGATMGRAESVAARTWHGPGRDHLETTRLPVLSLERRIQSDGTRAHKYTCSLRPVCATVHDALELIRASSSSSRNSALRDDEPLLGEEFVEPPAARLAQQEARVRKGERLRIRRRDDGETAAGRKLDCRLAYEEAKMRAVDFMRRSREWWLAAETHRG
jgi:hypothetical protein